MVVDAALLVLTEMFPKATRDGRFNFLGHRITGCGAVVADEALLVLTEMFPKATRDEVTVLEVGPMA